MDETNFRASIYNDIAIFRLSYTPSKCEREHQYIGEHKGRAKRMSPVVYQSHCHDFMCNVLLWLTSGVLPSFDGLGVSWGNFFFMKLNFKKKEECMPPLHSGDGLGKKNF
jgi:hypothetical protein